MTRGRVIILGVDPGLLRMGYGVIEAQGSNARLMEGGIIQGGPSSTPLEERLVTLYDGIREVIAEYTPRALALEKLYSHYAHPTTAVLMGHARGLVCLAAAQKVIPVFNYASTQVKHSMVGSGRASKAQVQRAIQTRLSLSQLPEPNDVADALALALCHWQMARTAEMTLQGLKAS
ncbi:MAG: crossover junction endodeoxyribonuclease RuvC [Chloroflexi bacterium]|nr:crossover junction endodeoxyribonuclease RuvC [Chloroflexota bacterium]